MALSTFPAELIRHIVSQSAPSDGWGKYWPLVTRPVDDVKAFLALRLVCSMY
jgi:hypothetical protein